MPGSVHDEEEYEAEAEETPDGPLGAKLQVKIPILKNPRVPGAYRTYKQRLDAFQDLKGYSDRQVGQLLYLEQTGEPAALIGHLRPKDPNFDVNAIIEVWDAEYNLMAHERAADVNDTYEQ